VTAPDQEHKARNAGDVHQEAELDQSLTSLGLGTRNRSEGTSLSGLVTLVGISAKSTPDEVEGLGRTAAEALCGTSLDDLSSPQRDLAHRAYDLLMEE
jgi:hypothetical protein